MCPRRREQDAPRPTPEEHARVKRELEESERERERLQRRIERLEKQNTRLRRELDAARRAGHRQAAPFAKTVTPEPKRPGRRAGAQYGQPAGASLDLTRPPITGLTSVADASSHGDEELNAVSS